MKTPDYSSRRFLIVDDEPFMLNTIERMLKQCKPNAILRATDGISGLKAIKDDFLQVDCIISDCNMQPANGLQFLQAVRMGLNPRIPREQPFIMLTGLGDTDTVKAALTLDVSGYVVKPVALEKLVQTIDRAFERPISLKEPSYYEVAKLPKIQVVFEASSTVPTACVILPRSNAARTNTTMRAKIAQFKHEHATRDGEDDVKIKNRRTCDILELREGHVLAQDIEAEEGATLLRRGVQLDRTMVERLRTIFTEAGINQSIWIGELEK